MAALHTIDMTPAQRAAAAVADLTARGHSAEQIASHLGIARRTVIRTRARNRAEQHAGTELREAG